MKTVSGQVVVRVAGGKTLKHEGIKVEFVGAIGACKCSCSACDSPRACTQSSLFCSYDAELFYDRGNHYEFLSQSHALASPGELRGAETFPFEFRNVEKAYESYHGINVKLRCGCLITIDLLQRLAG